MLSNRDHSRKNKANKALKASIYANIGGTLLKLLSSSTNNLLSSNQVDEGKVKKQIELVNLASECNEKMLNIFNKSQDSIGKAISKSYATKQHNRMYSAVKNKEDFTMISDIMPYIIDDDIMNKYHQLGMLYQSESKFFYSYINRHFTCHHFDTNDQVLSQASSSPASLSPASSSQPSLSPAYSSPVSLSPASMYLESMSSETTSPVAMSLVSTSSESQHPTSLSQNSTMSTSSSPESSSPSSMSTEIMSVHPTSSESISQMSSTSPMSTSLEHVSPSSLPTINPNHESDSIQTLVPMSTSIESMSTMSTSHDSMAPEYMHIDTTTLHSTSLLLPSPTSNLNNFTNNTTELSNITGSATQIFDSILDEFIVSQMPFRRWNCY